MLIVIRVLLVNINSAEWGDSYRILRASNFVQQFSYPGDEKRPPLFSIVLAVRPNSIDAILWGRLVMLGISFLALYVFYKLTKKYLATRNQQILAVVLLALNPVYLYWSLRIYADVPFSLLVLLCFYVFELWRERANREDKLSMLYLAVMGLICGLGILTRFEGYLLALATFIGILFTGRTYLVIGRVPFVIANGVKQSLRRSILSRIITVLPFLVTIVIIAIPWLLYRNPLTSSYFEETSSRKYDLEMLATYFISYIFVLGSIPAGSFIAMRFFKKPSTSLPHVLKKYPHIVAFVLLESLLILAWPAAVPRLFVPIITLLVIAFVSSLQASSRSANGGVAISILATVLTGVYIIAQNHLRLQFLGSHTLVFIFVSTVSVVGILAIVLNRRKLFLVTVILSMLALSASTIYLHKDIYRSIKEISVFSLREVARNGGGLIHNDTASIVNWYLPKSEYKNLDDKKYLTQAYLQENNIKYIILTNEFDPNLDIDLKKRPYLTLIKESKHITGGKMFFTWLVKVGK